MSVNKVTAEILDMEDERAKRRAAAELSHSDFETAGAHLKAAREAAGLELAEISEKIHIKLDHLAAIESSDTAALPARPYAIGFVKTYADYLGVEAGPVVARFKEDVGYKGSGQIADRKFETAAASGEIENRDMSLWAVAAVVVFILWCGFEITRPRDGAPVDMPAGLPIAAEPSAGPAVMDPNAAAAPLIPEVERQNIIEARITDRADPIYPRRCESSAQDAETVEVAFNITSGGEVAGARIVTSSNPCFDRAALNAVKRWRFLPRTVDGAARPAYDQRYRFRFDRPQ